MERIVSLFNHRPNLVESQNRQLKFGRVVRIDKPRRNNGTTTRDYRFCERTCDDGPFGRRYYSIPETAYLKTYEDRNGKMFGG